MNKPITPKGNESREAVASLGGYVYQLYQSALAWLELNTSEFLFLEVAEDYAIAAKQALSAVQVKHTGHHVTINSKDVVASIDSFVELRIKNPQLEIRLRHLTTSQIGKEKAVNDRIGETPTLTAWRNLARTGDLSQLREVLENSKLSKQTKQFIKDLDDEDFRQQFLKRIHFDCGALDYKFLKQQLRVKVMKALQERGGVASQADECLNNILIFLLDKSIQQKDRFVDWAELEKLLEKATYVSMNRAQLDVQNALIAKALASSLPKATDIITSRLVYPRPIDEVPLPPVIAQRPDQIGHITSSLKNNGVSWVFGAAGVGKTVAAKLAARQIGGNWASVNLRNLSPEQISGLLNDIAMDLTNEREIHGLLIDDFECLFEPYVVESFLSLWSLCMRRDFLLLVTTSKPVSSDLLFTLGLPATIEAKLGDFTELDIEQILHSLEVTDRSWVKYIYLISGGGHPQLVIAAIQSMQRSEWNTNEFRTFNSLLVGNSEIEQVRAQIRQRFLKDLSEGSRRLIERLSLTIGGFKRALVLDMAQIDPPVADGGILFDSLIGSWIDQQEKDCFSLSPLLSTFAANTLKAEQTQKINFEIANSLIKSRKLDPIAANSALLAAWNGKNEDVLAKLCLSVIGSDNSGLEMIAPHFWMLTHMRTDAFAYEDNPAISQMFRGAQLLLLRYEKNSVETFEAALESFTKETSRVQPEKLRAGMKLTIYLKLLLSQSNFGPVPKFLKILQKFDALFANRDHNLIGEFMNGLKQDCDVQETVSLLFLNQAHQIKCIADLLSLFEFLDVCDEGFRGKLFYAYDAPKFSFDVDRFISSAWLKEHEADTIDSVKHTFAYAKMENLANKWGRKDLAVACRKYQAIILDEYGNDKKAALDALEDGLTKYGITNPELIRAKARILYRANDHQASFELSSKLIDEGAPFSEAERSFLGREAAISAEKQGNFEEARRYYVFGAGAAKVSGLPRLVPMHIGLLADAAIASWHAGDHATCLRDFMGVLEELALLDSQNSLRAAHCHAVVRHVLLWLDQQATGETRYIANGEIPRIYPGIASNPEPHPDMEKRFLPVLELSWYMLAQIECHCLLDLGIARDIDVHLTKGPIREGQLLLTRGKLDKVFRLKDTELFLKILAETVAEFAFVSKQGRPDRSFNIKHVTYGRFPLPTQEEINTLITLAEQQILSFAATCLLSGDTANYDVLAVAIADPKGFSRRDEIVDCLTGKGYGTEYYAHYATLLFAERKAIRGGSPLLPIQIFDLAYKVLQTAKLVGQLSHMSKQVLNWLKERWGFIWEEQRFLLRRPSLYEKDISKVWEQKEGNASVHVLNILITVLPVLGISNAREVEKSLKDMLNTFSSTEVNIQFDSQNDTWDTIGRAYA